MPWSITERDGRYCVVKDSDGSTAGCHDSREKALAQQRALYANEPQMRAALEIDYSELEFPDPDPPAQPVRIEVGTVDSTQANDALIAALRSLSERQEQTEERQAELLQIVKDLAGMVTADREYLTASLDALSAAIRDQPAPVVNMPEFPQFPEIPAPVVNVQPPDVNVTVEAPPTSKRMIVERDPITNLIASVDVSTEE